MKICKEYHFEAAHSLPGHKGKCGNPHGHSYRLEVEVEALTLMPIGPSDGGMVIDFYDLDTIVETLLEKLDHTDLNVLALSLFGVARTTAELLCQGIAGHIKNGLAHRSYQLNNVDLSRVRLWETAKSWAEWTP